MSAKDFGDLVGMHEHAAHLGRLVGAPHPSADAQVGAPARARTGKHRGQVAGGEAHQRIVRIEGCNYNFADLAVGKRFAAAGPDDLDQHLLARDQPFARLALVGDDSQLGGAVGLVCRDSARLEERAHYRHEGLARHQRALDRRRRERELVAFLEDQLEERRRADVARRLEVGDGARLHLGLSNAARDHRAAEVMQPRLEHASRGREVVGKTVEHHVSRREPRGDERSRRVPEIGAPALGLVDRAGRDEDARKARWRSRVEAAEGSRRLLQRDELGLAGDRQRRQRSSTGDRGGIDIGECVAIERGVGLRVRHLRGQPRKEIALALGGRAGLQRIVAPCHQASQRLRRR